MKTKLHIVTHAPEDALRFGPLVINATEGFESYNSVFRRNSVLSNRQAPSRDIAIKFADMDRVKHLLSGGYWKDDTSWVQAGLGVQSLLAQKSILQSHLGWTPLESEPAGELIYFISCPYADSSQEQLFYIRSQSNHREHGRHVWRQQVTTAAPCRLSGARAIGDWVSH